MSSEPKVPDALRKTLHSAYTFIRSVETNKAIGQLTLDHLIQAQITRLKHRPDTNVVDSSGESTGDKPSRWDELTKLADSIDKVVQDIEKAGTDSAKLQALGIYETDKTLVNELTKAE